MILTTLLAHLILPLLPLLPSLPSLPAPQEPAPGPALVRVMSFNIRFANNSDGENVWPFRQHHVTGLIRHHAPDVFGLQEALGGQVGTIARALPGYAHFGSGRDGRAGGERCTLFYDRSRLEVVREATFWLSRKPDEVGADWGARLRRICTWGEFRDRVSGQVFFVFNTHFDHQSHEARRESAKLMVRKIEEIAGRSPAVFMGDLNCDPASAPYGVLTSGVGPGTPQPQEELALRDAALWSETGPYGPPGTWSGFGKADVPPSKVNYSARIDHVFVKNDVRVRGYSVIGDAWGGRTPSDHRPVTADLALGAPFVPIAMQLGTDWRFQIDPEDDGKKRGLQRFGFDDSGWPLLRAGESWERQGFEHDGAAWYRRSLRIPEAWREEKVTLELFGVDDELTLYVNEEEVARIGARTRSFFDGYAALHIPNGVLRFGADNLLALRVVDHRLWGGLSGYPLALRTDRQTTHVGKGLRLMELIPLQGFHIGSEDSRTLRYPIEVPALDLGFGWLRFGIHNSGDDTGDGGLRFRLEDEGGSMALGGFSRASGEQWWEHPVRANSSWTLVIEDLDTSLGGRNPGNGGQVEVGLRYERARKEAREQETPRRPRHVPEDSVFEAGSWYWFSEGIMPYAGAKLMAAEKKGKLLTISSIEENEWVMSRIHGITWLGLERIEGTWTHLDADGPRDGNAASFWYWDAGEPHNSPRELYGAIGFDVNGRWHDMLDTGEHYLVVEWGED